MNCGVCGEWAHFGCDRRQGLGAFKVLPTFYCCVVCKDQIHAWLVKALQREFVSFRFLDPSQFKTLFCLVIVSIAPLGAM